jgi:hypothetical protein
VSKLTTRIDGKSWEELRWGEGVWERWHEWLADHQYELVSAGNLQAAQKRLLDEFCRAEDVRQALKRLQPTDIPETNQWVFQMTTSDGKGNVRTTTTPISAPEFAAVRTTKHKRRRHGA